jgi:hypothetical protein
MLITLEVITRTLFSGKDFKEAPIAWSKSSLGGFSILVFIGRTIMEIMVDVERKASAGEKLRFGELIPGASQNAVSHLRSIILATLSWLSMTALAR